MHVQPHSSFLLVKLLPVGQLISFHTAHLNPHRCRLLAVSLCSNVVDAQEVVGGLEVQENFEEMVTKEQLVSSKTYEMYSGSWSG